MAWIAIVLWRYADPSVTGVYVVFYLLMGYAVVKSFGQFAASWFGARIRVDVVEPRNVPAALVIASFTVATGLIFGGSLWGEADPVGGGEGGWWIPLSFFLLGWLTLLIAFGLFLGRESGRLAHRLQRERSLEDAWATGVFLLAAGVALADAVSGEFWRWRHGLLTFGILACLVMARELFAGLAAAGTTVGQTGDVAGEEGPSRAPSYTRSTLEAIVYVLLDPTAEAASWLIGAAGCQPVCTLDNWPHDKGVLRPEHTLAELLRWASTVHETRQGLRPDAPPLWIRDRERLGERRGRPSEFDDRYYLDDSILHGPGVLARNGIERVVYVVPEALDDPLADLESYFADLLRAGITVVRLALAADVVEPRLLASASTPRRPPRAGFRRSSAGGFGTHVPEPSSGSSG